MQTVIDLLHEAAEKYKTLPYLGQKYSDSYSLLNFVESDYQSTCFAVALIEKGFKYSEKISILSEGRSTWVLGEFGLLKAGCISVPLSTKLSEDEITFRLEHSESKGILISENNFSKLTALYNNLHIKPLVIILSEKTETMNNAISKSGLSLGTNIFYFEDMIQQGKQLLEGIEGEKIKKQISDIQSSLTEEDVVTISYTSGTTGNPKGIMLSHKNYIHNTINSANLVRVETGWKILIMLPLDHSFAHTVGLYICLYRGMCMYFVDARGGPMASLRNLPKNLLETNPDFLLTVPALSGNFMKKMIQGVASKGSFINGIFQRGLKAGIARDGNGFNRPSFGVRLKNFFPWFIANKLVFPSLRKFFGTDIKFCIGGGALLEIKQQEFFNAIGVPVYQGYGLTENSPIICSNSAAQHKFGTSGLIIPNLEVKIMKDEKTECTVGEIGQIVTKGNSVMKGYFKNPQATQETIREQRLWSGDLGYIDNDGFLVVTGREKALLISADGEKYSPETIEEAVINTSKYINQIMAYNEQCKFTSCLITLNGDELKKLQKTSDELIDIIKEDLLAFIHHPDYSSIPPQWRPASFAIIQGIFDEKNGLVNSTMKLVRHKVKDYYKDRIEEIYSANNPHMQGNKKVLQDMGLVKE